MYQRRKTHLNLYRRVTAPLRLIPDFIILGVQRGGTTSLYRYLTEHPLIGEALRKECHYFDFNFTRPILWYQAQFPTWWHAQWLKKKHRGQFITGEGSPYYIAHPHAPQRLARTLPKSKLILLLRNPVDRAFSHYGLNKRAGFEELSFEAAIEAENERLSGEIEKMESDPTYYSYNHHKFTYLLRGHYLDQILQWRKYFSEQRMLILKSEDFYDNSEKILAQVHCFLNLPPYKLKHYPAHNRTNPKQEPAIREKLLDYYAPLNEKLYQFLARDMGWH